MGDGDQCLPGQARPDEGALDGGQLKTLWPVRMREQVVHAHVVGQVAVDDVEGGSAAERNGEDGPAVGVEQLLAEFFGVLGVDSVVALEVNRPENADHLGVYRPQGGSVRSADPSTNGWFS